MKFTVFQRINTGSVVLNQQEIRNCIYGGTLNEMLIDLNNTSKEWRVQYSRKPDKRMRDIEAILRFLSGYFGWKDYEKPMTSFLNKFMEQNKNASQEQLIQTHLMLCHCEKPLTSLMSRATKQSQKMDCFASLAMTIIAFVLAQWKELFTKAISTITKNIEHPFSSTGKAKIINRSVFESIMIAVGSMLKLVETQ